MGKRGVCQWEGIRKGLSQELEINIIKDLKFYSVLYF